MSDMNEMIRLDRITKIYNPGDVTEICLFSDFSLSVKRGEFVSVVGSNGSGKTSFLNIICGSVPVDAGRILIDGVDVTGVPEHRRYARIGRVWQNPATGTCSELTILENLALADCGPEAGKSAKANEKYGAKCRRFGLGRGVSPSRIDFYREQLSSLHLGLEDKLSQKAGALSGGQRQALALVMSAMTTAVSDAIQGNSGAVEAVVLPAHETTPQEPDFDAMYQELCTDVKGKAGEAQK